MKRRAPLPSVIPLSFAAFATLIPVGQALAQPAPPPAPAAPQAPPKPAQPAVEVKATPDLLAAGLAPKPGGLTPEDAGKAAVKSKASVRAKQAELKAAAAKVDQAFVGYFPRLTLTATYTRLSEIKQGSLGGALVGAANEGPLQVVNGAVVDSKGTPVGAAAFSFPVLLNSYSFVATLLVPVSDYVLRISQGYASAHHAEKGKRLEVEAETLLVANDAKVTYYNWVKAKGQVIVAKEAVEQAKAHVADAQKAFAVGLVAKGDVLRLEAQVAAAQQLEAEATAFFSIATEQLRIVTGIPADKSIEIGSDVMHDSATPPAESLQTLQDEALKRRLEIRALDETVLSLKAAENIARAGYLPRLDAIANATYANPNPRFVPQANRFDFTWDASLRLSWSINDTFSTLGAVSEAKARTATVAEQKAILRDGLRLEVASAYADMLKAAPTIEAAERGLAAAEESLRVRRELFRNGKSTSVELVDAETEVTRARLRRLDARVGLLVAKSKLDHAVGRDVPPRPVE